MCNNYNSKVEFIRINNGKTRNIKKNSYISKEEDRYLILTIKEYVIIFLYYSILNTTYISEKNIYLVYINF